MTLTFSRLASSKLAMRTAALTVFAGAGVFVASGAAGTSSEAILKSSFSAAIAADPAAARVGKQLPVAGSEDFWLKAATAEASTNVAKVVSIGDSIAMTVGGTSKQLKVEAVSDVAPPTTEIDTSADPQHLVLVTARDAKDANAKPIRFILEIPVADPAVRPGETARVL